MSKNNQAQNKNQAENKKDYSRYENNNAENRAENKGDYGVPNRAHTEMKNQAQNKRNDQNCR